MAWSHSSGLGFWWTTVPIKQANVLRPSIMEAEPKQMAVWLCKTIESMWCMFLWEIIKCVMWTNRERSKICGCNFATDHFRDSAHMETLDCIIVHGSMPSISSSAVFSLVTSTIFYWCSWRWDCSQTRWIIENISTCSGRAMIGDNIDVTVTLFGPNLEE